ncbi:MAG: hypothetical protein WB995_19630 [Candidatus Acidiferrales bacterium]
MLDKVFLREEVERYIDRYYLQAPILKRHRDVAAMHLLRVFDEWHRLAGITPFKTTNERLEQHARLRWAHDAIPWALRWIWSDCPVNNTVSLDLNWDVYAEARDLMELSSRYDDLCRCFTLYSRGFFTAETVKERKEIRFSYRSDFEERRDAVAFIYSTFQDRSRVSRSLIDLVRETVPVINAILPHYITKDGEFSVLCEIPPDMWQYFKRWASVLVQDMRFDMPGTWNLGDFTLDDFKAFWKSLLALSIAQIQAHQLADGAVGTRNGAIASLILRLTEESLHAASSLFPISDKSWLSIAKMLVYEPSRKYWDPYWQPIIKISDGTLLISPHLIATSSPQRNLLTLLARSAAGRAVYNRLSPQKEAEQLRGLAEVFKRFPLRTRVPVPQVGGDMLTDIDLLAFDEKNKVLLLVHAKWLMRPDTVQEVLARDEEVQTALKTAARAAARIAELGTGWLSSVLGTEIKAQPTLRSIVVSRDFIPSGWVNYPQVSAIDSDFVTSFVGSPKFNGLGSVYDACANFYQDFERKHPLKKTEAEIEFGEYVFKSPSSELI